MKRPWGCLLIVALFLQPLAVGEIDEYVSHPGNIPDFHNFSTPQLEPGQEGEFSLDIHNRYNDSLENAVIVAEIYHRADIDESESLDEIPSKELPYIRETCWSSGQDGNENCIATTDSRKATFDIGTIEFNETISLEFEVQSKEDTKEGTYFVRFSMNFDYNSTARVMQSRGYWSMEQWEDATTNVTEGAPGNINLEVLEVDGIIPDSSFGIKKPIPLWPLYVLITLTILFAGLSVVFYLEEEGNYPELNKWLQKQRGKLNQLRLRFKYRKGG
ncbi:MAG: hypothetical protein VYA07_04270 [Candidatus Thermoplasmatota archaeon]|nr:hypothetical protein [Candidatus Thermoplasmatota archaeon]